MSLSLKNIRVLHGSQTLLDSVSLDCNPRELVGVVGPNGAGKSTLLAVAAGLQAVVEGSVAIDNRRLQEYHPTERARLLAWLQQDGDIHWPLSVERLVALGRTPHQGNRSPGERDRQIVNEVLRRTDCSGLRHRDATTLSGGERARVLLARALAGEPAILLADEPNASLDIGHQLQTMDLLREYVDAGNSCLLVLHDLSMAARYCDRIYMLHRGKLVAQGRPAEVLTADNLRRVYRVEVELGAHSMPSILPVKRVK